VSVYFYLKINKAKCQNVIIVPQPIMVLVLTVQTRDITYQFLESVFGVRLLLMVLALMVHPKDMQLSILENVFGVAHIHMVHVSIPLTKGMQ
jgi:hypothetical protein